jgi:hypothetical protein
MSARVLAARFRSPLSYTNLIVFGDSIVDQGDSQAADIANGFSQPAPAAAGDFGGLSGAAGQAVIAGAATAVSTAIGLLPSAGAKKFPFVGVGNVGGIPEVAPFGAPIAAGRRPNEI